MTVETINMDAWGTGHPLDLKPTQVQFPDGVQFDGEIHNVLGVETAASTTFRCTKPVPATMCGIRFVDGCKPYDRGPTTCRRCGLLAAYRVSGVQA